MNEKQNEDIPYDGKLGTIHQLLLAYILLIDEICRKYDIKYFLAGGTLLGAIRNNGFIPWDDDADIMMKREDYNRFLEVAPKVLSDKIFIQNPDTDMLNHQPFTKLRLNDTLFPTKFTAKFPEMHNGLFIDILAHDRTAPTSSGRKGHLLETLAIRSMVFNKWGKTPIKTGGRHPFLCKMATFMKDIIPMRLLEGKMFRTLRRYENRETGYLYDGMGRNLRRGSFPEYYLDEAIMWSFEGYELPVPKEYDKYLTWLYGDYMTPPPPEKQKITHKIMKIDLGEYEDFEISKMKEYDAFILKEI